MTKIASLLSALALAATARAHVALWHPSMFGYNWPNQSTADPNGQQNNNNEPVNPLRENSNLTVSEWFGHGLLDFPPLEGDYLDLVSGGSIMGQLACNRQNTIYGLHEPGDQLMEYACDTTGPLHVMNTFGEAPNISYFGGTSIAIAYTSDITTIQPNDLTVISVNYSSVWWRETAYEIPAGLPSCPSGGCLCTWNWIHEADHLEGYGSEIYNVMYRCNVSGATNDASVVGTGKVPTFCEDAPSNCTSGPKTPMYIYQAEGNNIEDVGQLPPTYNARYGFADGPQNDIFTSGGASGGTNSTTPTSKSSNATASAVVSSSAALIVASSTVSSIAINAAAAAVSASSAPTTVLGSGKSTSSKSGSKSGKGCSRHRKMKRPRSAEHSKRGRASGH
ncbi:hypothetical protein EHS25_010230 [Saitozyma podzolica]|uniref:Uncharacterized protein n=1 Tax=Saitozyma podzolica TaxID=1890683 RepID=A0A427YIX8_9TREE|nr:hypothetical protein EHS25_010230 [Saitozyma podzolica]